MRNHEQQAGQPYKQERLRRMSEEAKARLTDHNEAQADWEATCRKCGAKLTGTLADMRAHVCAP